MITKGKLFVIPNIIADGTQAKVIPLHVTGVLPTIQYFLAEDLRTARRFLSSLRIFPSIEVLKFEVLNKDTTYDKLPALMQPALDGQHVGVISESGCPGVADPGALAVRYAHEHGIEVVPLVGPSSLLLALMASGLNGQRFCFHGYLPIETREAGNAIRNLERESAQRSQTQIFIETPYRNNQLFQLLLQTLSPGTRLTVAIDLTGSKESVQTYPVKEWKKKVRNWDKLPAVFLFQA